MTTSSTLSVVPAQNVAFRYESDYLPAAVSTTFPTRTFTELIAPRMQLKFLKGMGW